MYDFYVSTEKWSSSTKILLIELGFIYLLIHDNVFLGCNYILSANSLFTLDNYIALTKYSQANPTNYRTKLITSMNTPEKMKIFLHYYPDIDLAELIPGNSDLYQQRTPLTIFDRLLKMEPFYYETIDQTPLVEEPDFTSDHCNVRSANMLYLFQKFICNGAKVRKDYYHKSVLFFAARNHTHAESDNCKMHSDSLVSTVCRISDEIF